MEIWGIWFTKAWNRDLDNSWFVLPGHSFPYWSIDQEEAKRGAKYHLKEYSQYEIRIMPDEIVALIPEAAMALQNWLTIQRLRVQLDHARLDGWADQCSWTRRCQ